MSIFKSEKEKEKINNKSVEMKQAEWIEKIIIEENFNIQKVYLRYDEYLEFFNSQCSRESYRAQVRTVAKSLKDISDDDIVRELTSTAASKQKFQDMVRILRKELREQFRVFNAIEGYETEIIELLKDHDLSNFKIVKQPKNKKKRTYGILQLSDLHLNELVTSKDTNNTFDFIIASKRLKKFVTKAITYFKANGVDSVLIAGTGDFLNSDRRLDELLSQSTNRAKATLLTCFLIKQVIVELGQEFPISVAMVSGNESRADFEMAYSEIGLSNNYDWSIYQILKLMFDGSNVKFLDNEDPSEQIIKLGDFTILLAHGFQFKSNYKQSISNVIAKWSQRGIQIDYVLWGHIHETLLSDFSGRSASLVGGNAYSDKGLNLYSKASQNIYIIEGKDIDRIAIDLQDTTGIEGYEIKDDLKAYNAKSVDKTYKKTVSFQVII